MVAPVTRRARALRHHSTAAERRLWRHLRHRQLGGSRFRRQHPVGPYIADFACIEKRLVVEVDGGQHGDTPRYDARRTAYFTARGFRTLRYWNHDVLNRLDAVLADILRHL